MLGLFRNWLSPWLGHHVTKNSAGEAVVESISAEQAMQLNAVYACVRIISNVVSTLPLKVYVRDGNGDIPDPSHPFQQALYNKLNPLQTSDEFFRTQTMHAMLTGNCFTQLIKMGDTIELIPINPARVNIQKPLSNAYKPILTIDGVEQKTLIWTKYLTVDGFTVLSPVGLQAQTLLTTRNMANFNHSIYKNGAKMAGFIRMAGKALDGVSQKLFYKNLENFSNSERANSLMLLNSDMEFIKANLNMTDAQFLETMRFSREQIASIYGIPSYMISETQGGSYAKSEIENANFLAYALMPWLIMWEKSLNASVFTPDEVAKGYYVKFNTNALVRSDYQTRMDGYAKAITNGIMTLNEVRKLEGLPAVDEGNDLFMPVNIQKVQQAGEQPKDDNE
jgi:HK97 family phage portal protein